VTVDTAVINPVSTDLAEMDAAARDMGIVPGDPAYAFYLGLRRMFADQEVRMDLLTAQLKGAQPKIDPVHIDRLSSRMVEAFSFRINDVINTLRWRAILASVTAVIGFAVVCVGGGYWWGYQTSQGQFVNVSGTLIRALSMPEAVKWVTLMRLNNIDTAWNNCQWLPQKMGGEACSFPLWISQPPAKPINQGPVPPQ
jgi:hypothetical protein